jgi:alpha-beta hydrolase superfamily lysophospholipase
MGKKENEPTPSVPWATVESNRIKTSDGEELGTWLFRAPLNNDTLSKPVDKGIVIVLHGVHGSRSGEMPVYKKLVADGYAVLAVSQRAHGDSTGSLIDIGWSSQYDVLAAVGFLERTCPGKPIYVLGRSMGSASAIFAAKALGKRVSGYLLEEPYKDLDSAVWFRLQHALPRGLDYIAYHGMVLWAPVFLPVSQSEISPYKHIVDIPKQVPVVLLAGSKDRNAHVADVQLLCDRIQDHAKLIVFEGAGHEPLDMRFPEQFEKAIKAAFGSK